MEIHFFDYLSVEVLFVLTVLVMLLMLEAGFRFGSVNKAKKVKAQTAQVRALMGATLGLLAFMLAFTFATAQNHFESRIQLQVDDALVLKKAFMQADRFSEPVRSDVRELLLEYTGGRAELREAVRTRDRALLYSLLERSEAIQLELWSAARQYETLSQSGLEASSVAGGFMPMVLSMMELQTRRVEAALVNRIPLVIWLTLYFTAVMSMIVVGYQAGLTEKRSPVATFSLALAFSAVMMLIMDLDRPLQSLFELDVTVMDQLAAFMRKQ
jgi:hypothetical protein